MRLAALLLLAALPALAQDTRKSGFEFMSAQTQAMQRDDARNPGMLWVRTGETLWRAGGRACASCHGDAAQSMRGVAARYPALSGGQVVDLAQRINQCRTGAQHEPAWKAESEELLGMEAYITLQSRGMQVAPAASAAPAAQRGRHLYFQRIGQLNLSCAQCHDDNAGRRLGSALIPQGHANAYPIYRLEWQAMGSLQRRLRNCMSGVRAEVPPYGAPDLVDLEAYLASRAAGMKMETPGVRP